MRAITHVRSLGAAVLAALVVVIATPATADLRISDLDVFFAGHELTVNVAVLGVLAPSFHEGIQSGIPSHVRYTVQLWQYHRFWRDSLLLTRVVERQLAYNVVSKEYRVVSLTGEVREPHVTRDFAEAQRVLSQVRGVRLAPGAEADPAELIYVRVQAVAALNGDNSFVTRLAGTAEQAIRQSGHRTLSRVQ